MSSLLNDNYYKVEYIYGEKYKIDDDNDDWIFTVCNNNFCYFNYKKIYHKNIIKSLYAKFKCYKPTTQKMFSNTTKYISQFVGWIKWEAELDNQ